jgi:hypothetical protein
VNCQPEQEGEEEEEEGREHAGGPEDKRDHRTNFFKEATSGSIAEKEERSTEAVHLVKFYKCHCIIRLRLKWTHNCSRTSWQTWMRRSKDRISSSCHKMRKEPLLKPFRLYVVVI